MAAYLSNYGPHFSKALCEFACKRMRKRDASGNVVPVEPWGKKQVDDLLATHGIALENDNGYDSVYVANMCRADYYKKSVTDEAHLAMFIRDTIDDPDAPEGAVFRRWYATAVGSGIAIIWEDLI